MDELTLGVAAAVGSLAVGALALLYKVLRDVGRKIDEGFARLSDSDTALHARVNDVSEKVGHVESDVSYLRGRLDERERRAAMTTEGAA